MAEINRIHVSPGIYASETVDMKAAANSIGVTKPGVVGETLKGPAFQPYWVHSPKEYNSVFGGTSPKKFPGSNYPQYELPYIANEYLKAGTELCVVRTLGFSGYNAGPAWVITGEKTGGNDKYVIAVLRSRGTYKFRPEYANLKNDSGCACDTAYDAMTFNVGELSAVTSCSSPISYNMDAVKLGEYYSLDASGSECTSYTLSGTSTGFSASYGNFGRFTIKCVVGPSKDGDTPDTVDESRVVKIPVSLNKSDKDYILKVLGTTNNDGDQPLFVESLYDTAWENLVVNDNYNIVSSGLTEYNVGYAVDYGGLEPVNAILTKFESELTKKDIGKRFLYAANVTNGSPSDVKYHEFDYDTNTPKKTQTGAFVTPYCQEASIYTVVQITDDKGKKSYVYKAYNKAQTLLIENDSERLAAEDRLLIRPETDMSSNGTVVYNYEDGQYYKNIGSAHVLSAGTVSVSSSGGYSTEMALNVGILRIEGCDETYNLVSGTTSGPTIERRTDGTWEVDNASYYLSHSGVGQEEPFKWYLFERTDHPEPEYEILKTNNVVPVACDLNDYKTQFRYSSTPWVVSNAKGDAKKIEVNRLFRFHTISDGDGSITEVKVSIENIRPDTGEFDVVVRGYNDSDSSVNVLERFVKCTMGGGKSSIAYKIGTIDGVYESKSKYITVEVAESTAAKNSVPAGFIGYPIPRYDGQLMTSGDNPATNDSSNSNVKVAPITYNTVYNDDIAKRKQYFGISDMTGYDYDYFSFKGKMATLEDPDFVSNGFHLDCRLNPASYGNSENAPKITVDGIEGYVFDTVNVNQRTSTLTNTPIISTEEEMAGSIYEDVKLRKFTMVFAGGFDGWDIYRDQRTNTDEFATATYKGYVNSTTGMGYGFDVFNDTASYGIEERAITSDYYSTLAGVSLLKNPEEVDINVLATPGIDTINNTRLVNQVFDILEDRADTFYVVTTPDKENGASDYADDIPEVDEIVSDFSEKEVYSDYAASFYPWVKIDDDGEYVWLPATRDVIRNLAESDNTNTTMNLAPAGTTRGKVEAIRARKNLKNSESDELYENNLNPVRTYAQEGIVIMGQKTLRKEDDLLNRIDVRRMVLRMRKLIAIGCLGLIFEPNDNNTLKAFKSIISGIMQNFIDNRAIEKWTMNVDDSEEARDRLEINATIFIKPIRALEYITLNFVVTNNDVYFES